MSFCHAAYLCYLLNLCTDTCGLLTVAVSYGSASKCEKGWLPFGEENCVTPFAIPENFADAMDVCAEHDAQIVSLANFGDVRHLHKQFPQLEIIWVNKSFIDNLEGDNPSFSAPGVC